MLGVEKNKIEIHVVLAVIKFQYIRGGISGFAYSAFYILCGPASALKEATILITM